MMTMKIKRTFTY